MFLLHVVPWYAFYTHNYLVTCHAYCSSHLFYNKFIGLGILDCTGADRFFDCIDSAHFDNEIPPTYTKYNCPKAAEAFNALSEVQGPFRMEDIPVRGSACGHWEEDMFVSPTTNELMQWRLLPNMVNSLSTVSIGGLDDIEFYEVDYSKADPYPITAAVAAELLAEGADVLYTTSKIDFSRIIDVLPRQITELME